MKSFLSAAMTLSLLIAGAAGAELKIREASLQNESLKLSYPSDRTSYYVLGRQPELEDEPAVPRQLALGKEGEASFSDALDSADTGFFQLDELSKATPEDTDGDGIDDVYELEHGLNPMDSTDAEKDADGDGRSNRKEYEEGGDSAVPNRPGPPGPVSRGFFAFDVVTKSGAVDNSGRNLYEIDRFTSMNDQGWVVFSGKTKDPDGTIRPNIFSVNPANRSVRALLNTSPVFELPQNVGGEAPSQAFTAPMINNQNRVLAWRLMYARVQVGFPFGQILNAPLTYIESWSPTGNPTDGRRDMPLQSVVMGNGGAGAASALFFWLNPISAGTLPSPYQGGSPWDGVHGRNSESFPAMNNKGQVVFFGLKGANYLSTSLNPKPEASFPITTNPRRARIADDGTVATALDENGTREIAVFSASNIKNSRASLAKVGPLWSGLGVSPSISDDGTVIVFYGVLTVSGGEALKLNPGPGVFAARRSGQQWRLFRVAGQSRSGYLDPGEDDPTDGFALNGDQGPIVGFDLDARCSANNKHQIVYLATSRAGFKSVFSTRILDETANEPVLQMSSPTLALSVGDQIPGETATIADLELYDALNNNAEKSLVCWAKTSSQDQYVLRGTDGVISLSSHDRLVKGTIRVSEILKAYPQASFDLSLKNQATGQTFTQLDLFADSEEAPVHYHSVDEILDDDRVEADSQWANQQLVLVSNRSESTLEETLDFYTLFDVPGPVEATVTIRIPGQEPILKVANIIAEPEPAVAALINSVDEHLNDPDAPPGAPAEKQGFWHRLLTTKVMAIAFDFLSSQPARLLGGVDGFWSGAKGDYEAVTGLYEALKSPIESAKAVGKMFSQIGDISASGMAKALEGMWGGFVNSVDERIKWAGLNGGPLTQSGYVEGYVIGYGTEQWASSLLTLGIGKAVLQVTKAAKVGVVLAGTVSTVKKGLNAAIFQVTRFVPKSKLEPTIRLLRSELGAVFPGGIRPIAAELFEVSPQLRKLSIQALNQADEIISKYPPNLLAASKARMVILAQRLGSSLTENGLIGMARLSEALRLSPTDEAFQTLLRYCENAADQLDKVDMVRFLESFADGPQQLFKRGAAPGEFLLGSSQLVLKQGSQEGHSILHILGHSVDIRKLPHKTPPHSVFSIPRRDIFELLDEAWKKRGRFDPVDPFAFELQAGRVIGSNGEQFIRVVIRRGTSVLDRRITTIYPIERLSYVPYLP